MTDSTIGVLFGLATPFGLATIPISLMLQTKIVIPIRVSFTRVTDLDIDAPLCVSLGAFASSVQAGLIVVGTDYQSRQAAELREGCYASSRHDGPHGHVEYFLGAQRGLDALSDAEARGCGLKHHRRPFGRA